MKTNDAPCAVCGKYSIDCNCGLFGSKENESMESHQERKELYELTSIRDESLHVQPYVDMIDRLTYVQKADFAKHALDLERDCATYKAMFEEVSRERNGWISEYRAAREEVERTKLDRDLFRIERDKVQERANHWFDEKEKIFGRVNALEEWLSEYRDDLKKANVFHKNQGIINAINELLACEHCGGSGYDPYPNHDTTMRPCPKCSEPQ